MTYAAATRALVAEVVAVCEVSSTRAFRWFGALVDAGPAAPGEWPEALLLRALTAHLYAHVAITGHPVPGSRPGLPIAGRTVPPDGGWTAQQGWRVAGAQHPDALILRRGGLTVRADPGQVLPGHRGDGVVMVRAAAPWPPGFILTGAREPAGPLLRVYWNPSEPHRDALVGLLDEALRAADLPFRLKVLAAPGVRPRSDGVVTYLARRDWVGARPVVAAVLDDAAAMLREQTPAFTRALAPGVAIADDPGDGSSFGEHRSAALTQALLAAGGIGRERDRTDAVIGALRRAGVDPATPHLTPGRPDPPFDHRPRPRPRSGDGADEAIDRLVGWVRASAVESGDRAAWLGGDATTPPGEWRVATTTGGDLYDGTAGIAMVLAEHAVMRGDDRSGRLAAAAARHALASGAAEGDRYGLFDGSGGIAAACGRAAMLLHDGTLATAAAELGSRLDAAAAPLREPDLLGGRAGVVFAALIVERAFGCDAALGAAAHHVAGLAAERPGLTGLAHGVSGVSAALLELWNRLADPRALDAAQAGFAREDSLMDDRGRWPDLRGVDGLPEPAMRTYATAWCHGAPGIALARLRAWELTGEPRHRDTARTALVPSVAVLRAMARDPGPDLSACHGLAGLGEVVLEAAVRLDDDGLRDAATTAVRAIRRLVLRGDPVPCGTPHGQTATLMLGVAGVARFLMRFGDPSLPGVLLPRPEEWETTAGAVRTVAAATVRGRDHDD